MQTGECQIKGSQPSNREYNLSVVVSPCCTTTWFCMTCLQLQRYNFLIKKPNEK
nr:MAG TPA: hypothetical protein [Caudoviricetes sp.]